MGTDEGYLLDNQQAESMERFDALSELFESDHRSPPGTSGPRPRLAGLGGGGRWSEHPDVVGSADGTRGYVLATDIDTSWLEGGGGAGYDVLRHDVGTEPAPSGPFDLIHARLVLVHVPDRDGAITSMVDSLRPGGWLLLEEADPGLQELACPDEWGPDQRLANRLKREFRTLLAQRGVDLAFGRTLPRRLRSAGLGEVESDAYFPMGGPFCDELERATVEQIRELLVGGGLAEESDIDRHLANVVSGRLDLATSPMVSAWGRKPD